MPTTFFTGHSGTTIFKTRKKVRTRIFSGGWRPALDGQVKSEERRRHITHWGPPKAQHPASLTGAASWSCCNKKTTEQKAFQIFQRANTDSWQSWRLEGGIRAPVWGGGVLPRALLLVFRVHTQPSLEHVCRRRGHARSCLFFLSGR